MSDAPSHDPEVAEEYAEAVGTDPTPEQIDTYLALEGEPPLAEQAATAGRSAVERQDADSRDPEPIDPERIDPQRASSERAAQTPPHEDAERMESALRVGGPLVRDDPDEAQRERERPSEPGPGTSLA